MEVIEKYFPELTEIQKQQFEDLYPLFSEWNDKINLVSRKDIGELYLHHVLHSLAIVKYTKIYSGSKVLDLGTGGGFPGIPLAIMLPEVHFHLVDSVGKKVMVVNDLIERLRIQNASAQHIRAEELKSKYDFVVTRAVATADKLLQWSRKLLKPTHHNPIPNGIIALKGGNIKEETKLLPKGEYVEFTPITDYFEEEYFQGKYVMYIQG